MNKFYIDINYVTSITVTRAYNYPTSKRPDESDEDYLVRRLKTPNMVATSTSSEDHPEFAKLRNQLENEGYIKTQRSWWNGDTVLKEFFLNDVKFKENGQFVSASAMRYTLEHGNQ